VGCAAFATVMVLRLRQGLHRHTPAFLFWLGCLLLHVLAALFHTCGWFSVIRWQRRPATSRRFSSAPLARGALPPTSSESKRIQELQSIEAFIHEKIGGPSRPTFSRAPLTELQGSETEAADDEMLQRIFSCHSPQEVLALISYGQEEESGLRTAHVVAAMRRLTMKRKMIPNSMDEDPRVSMLVVDVGAALIRDPPSGQQVATMLWAVSMLRNSVPKFLQLAPAVCEALPSVVNEMNPQNLTMSLTAVAKLGREDPQLRDVVPELLDAIIAKVDDMDGIELSSAIWALGALEVEPERIQVFTQRVLEGMDADRLTAMGPSNLAKLIWGMAQHGVNDEEFLATAGDVFSEMVEDLSPRSACLDLPMVICAFARLQYRHPRFTPVAAESLLAKKRIKKVNNWGICALVWSMAGPDEVSPSEKRLAHKLRDQIIKRRLTNRQIERSWMGPQEWMARESEDSVLGLASK